ncbi:MAG: O-antigen ligase family protein [Candidatus Competibacter sp.]|nr:O-antigen ligase family protein [Candidatus Competibacter sp.]MDG4583308.1 O-antigen ligase family protein [Candidatus Competibacter sp.]
MAILALIPGLLAAYFAFHRSPQFAFLHVYLPALLLIPDYYRWIAPGLPDPTANQAAAVAIFLVFLARGAPGYRFSPFDLVIFGLAGVISYSEYRASGYNDAQNLMFAMLSSVVIPYVLAKSLVEPLGARVEFAKKIVMCLFIVAIICLYEARFGVNPWQKLLGPFFSGQGLGWIITFRWGLARTAGPYGHAILAGIMMVAGYRIQRWLEWSGAWTEPRHPWFKWVPWPKLTEAQIYTLGLLGGALITLVKGPWLAGIVAGVVVFIGRMRNRWIGVGILLVFIFGVCLPGFLWFLQWAGVGRENALTENQETAAYRLELIENYMDIAKEEAVWGWGLIKWPKVPGQPSIDNYYLLLFLMHGVVAFTLFMTVLLGMSIRLMVHAMRQPNPQPLGSSLAFTLVGIYVVYIVSVATVYMGNQTVALLFLITGWAEGYLHAGREQTMGAVLAPRPPPAPYRFRRILS